MLHITGKSIFGDGVLIKGYFWGEEQTFGIIAVHQSRCGAWPPMGKGRNTPKQPLPFPCTETWCPNITCFSL